MAAAMVNGSGVVLNGHNGEQAGPSKQQYQQQRTSQLDTTVTQPAGDEGTLYENGLDALQLSR